MNFTIGAFDQNFAKIAAAVATTGYPPRDLLNHARFIDLNLTRLQPLIVSDTTPVAETIAEGESRVRSGNAHASIYRIHLFEKTGRFERR